MTKKNILGILLGCILIAVIFGAVVFSMMQIVAPVKAFIVAVGIGLFAIAFAYAVKIAIWWATE